MSDTETDYTQKEVEALKSVAEALADKTHEQRLRILFWAADKFCNRGLCFKPEFEKKR